ncbi:hypothetical protein PHYBLDRAFT_175180 [Phycomyces blakesleeanus NRRL 1555(-)]|uniref:Uncharacterized protein n=1 Tax=Phycomyces blakesleeanus (strain ATCC 8743b / DSM 1359 / FGSC 10004 / NBRC 33097 / NRRL 1555) TaxID=763407 RepID=A0A163CXR2_PHYB8|nr:hypothetical protein PHYBLDRAFT_175180 [Phycomyces blakesleeanus NRRL 1555(-)]OAD66370.1 hypothetical protein PHYBLDRAFT_175180 [Phycomyces blakesleeanus NRRL 1555(-)]|eukprot:XP_018284410.1 hypothetical protein PHYBLDRAFT_175180 [Phycomyces blakesleeanus NRRL 1555(-)]
MDWEIDIKQSISVMTFEVNNMIWHLELVYIFLHLLFQRFLNMENHFTTKRNTFLTPMTTDNQTFVRTICKTERVLGFLQGLRRHYTKKHPNIMGEYEKLLKRRPAMFDDPSSSASNATTNLNSNNGPAPMEFVIENSQDIYGHEISDKDEYSNDHILFDLLDDYDETTALQKLYDFIE